MIRNFKRRSVQFLFSALLLIGISACNKDISLSLDNSKDESTGIVPVDSIQVNASTYLLDDVPTSGNGIILVGKNVNSITGSVSATSYMQMGIGTITTASIPTNAQYDSITFVLKPNKYFYGDTTKMQTIAVHEVTQPIILKQLNLNSDTDQIPFYVNGSAIYNNQKFDYAPLALGTKTFKPFVHKLDSVAIKLDNNLGSKLFSYIKTGNGAIASNDNFKEFFKGIALVPGDNNTAIVGFSDTVSMQIHYNFVNAEGFKVKGATKFILGSKSYQFNNVTADRAGTAFSALSLTHPELKSTVTNGDVFLEGSTGTVVKINFPTLLDLVNDPTVAINRAELVIETEGKYLNSFFNPAPNLMLMVANAGGNPIGFLQSITSSNAQIAPYIGAADHGQNATYSFNLLRYLSSIKSGSYYNSSLYLTLPLPDLLNQQSRLFDLFTKTDRVIVAKDANKKPKIKLNILYTKF